MQYQLVKNYAAPLKQLSMKKITQILGITFHKTESTKTGRQAKVKPAG